jgi:hypothetical protein
LHGKVLLVVCGMAPWIVLALLRAGSIFERPSSTMDIAAMLAVVGMCLRVGIGDWIIVARFVSHLDGIPSIDGRRKFRWDFLVLTAQGIAVLWAMRHVGAAGFGLSFLLLLLINVSWLAMQVDTATLVLKATRDRQVEESMQEVISTSTRWILNNVGCGVACLGLLYAAHMVPHQPLWTMAIPFVALLNTPIDLIITHPFYSSPFTSQRVPSAEASTPAATPTGASSAEAPSQSSGAHEGIDLDREDRAIQALPTLFPKQQAATQLLAQSGFPPSRMPPWESAEGFWTSVVTEIRNGAPPGDLGPVLWGAAQRYPSNEALKPYLDAS